MIVVLNEDSMDCTGGAVMGMQILWSLIVEPRLQYASIEVECDFG